MAKLGRPVGSKTRITAGIKEEFVATFHWLGREKFRAWANTHQSEFYRLFAAMAPKEIDVDATVRDETALTDAELAAIATGRRADTAGPTAGPTEPAEVH